MESGHLQCQQQHDNTGQYKKKIKIKIDNLRLFTLKHESIIIIILYYLYVESIATRPITDTAQCRLQVITLWTNTT
jgi:hypothetical protein